MYPYFLPDKTMKDLEEQRDCAKFHLKIRETFTDLQHTFGEDYLSRTEVSGMISVLYRAEVYQRRVKILSAFHVNVWQLHKDSSCC